MKLHKFYREFNDTSKEDRFRKFDTPSEPISLFVIFQMLTQVRAQKKYFEEREVHLLALANLCFKELYGNKSKKTQ